MVQMVRTVPGSTVFDASTTNNPCSNVSNSRGKGFGAGPTVTRPSMA
jgi:hypothetical protein